MYKPANFTNPPKTEEEINYSNGNKEDLGYFLLRKNYKVKLIKNLLSYIIKITLIDSESNLYLNILKKGFVHEHQIINIQI